MTIHVLVTSSNGKDPEARAVRRLVSPRPPAFQLLCCSSPVGLVPALRNAVLSARQKIGLLDLHGHSGPGVHYLGRQILFKHGNTDLKIAEDIGMFLTDDARIRLLGCNSGAEERGRDLLRSLQRAFGKSRVVYGAIRNIWADEDFDWNGFKSALEDKWLFSSIEANGGVAPDQFKRNRDHKVWVACARHSTEQCTESQQ